ncbi:hypothetical protein MNBD_DELTA01-726 [hydrothermal vent metagenome]|uniref:Uncharacterized protein n=1 Tax=hydrothermal vent metagenome TaxID=652676 RepID=A0A3B0R4S4_9ZZZZ
MKPRRQRQADGHCAEVFTGGLDRGLSFTSLLRRSAQRLVVFSIALIFIAVFTAGCSNEAEEKAFFRAERALGEGEHLEAIAFYRIFVEDFPESEFAPEAQYKIGVVYDSHLKNITKALDAYSMLLYLYPGSPEATLAREQRAKVYSSWGRHRESIAEYAWMLEYGSEERAGGYRYNIALEYIKMGDYGQARIELDELIKSAPPEKLLSNAYYQVATALQLGGNYSGAVEAYDLFIEKFPGHKLTSDALLHKATVLEQSGKLKEALALMKELRVRYPELSEALAIKIASAEKRFSNGPKLNKKRKRRRRRRK